MSYDENGLSKGACLGADPDLFFPNFVDENGEDVFDDGTVWESYGDTAEFYGEGKKICAVCPIREECLSNAMANKERFGLWGGLIPIERRRIERRERRKRLQERRRREALGLPVEDDIDDEDPDDELSV